MIETEDLPYYEWQRAFQANYWVGLGTQQRDEMDRIMAKSRQDIGG